MRFERTEMQKRASTRAIELPHVIALPHRAAASRPA
jgi:hypothetical protein